MMMLLTILCTSLFVTVICGAALLKAAHRDEEASEIRGERKIAIDPPRFFAGDLMRPASTPKLPLELLLTQLERHVRLEQAAAETFLDRPTPESLHSPSASRFVN
jgi:hypothetical protein